MALTIFAGGISMALLTILTIALANRRAFPRLAGGAEPAAPLPFISVLIPARDEATHIAKTVSRLLAQRYPQLEVLVLDDHSEDGTADIVAALAVEPVGALGQPAAHRTPPVRLLPGAALPPGWSGKNWACQQLAQAARGEVLVFTDADVSWEPGAICALVAELQHSGADLLTVWPTQRTESWGERLVVPLMALAVMGYLPVRLVHEIPHPLAAAANGQCLVFTREAYARSGGHAAVANDILEDVHLAQLVKAAGLQLRMADGAGLVWCRMYHGLAAVIDGYAKNILAGHGGRVALLLLSTLFHWSIFLWPWAWLALGATWSLPDWPLWPLSLVAAGIAARALTAHATGQRPTDALWLPVSVLLMTWIAAKAIWWHYRHGGPMWKGRVLRR